jgi:hypothetical protein
MPPGRDPEAVRTQIKEADAFKFSVSLSMTTDDIDDWMSELWEEYEFAILMHWVKKHRRGRMIQNSTGITYKSNGGTAS